MDSTNLHHLNLLEDVPEIPFQNPKKPEYKWDGLVEAFRRTVIGDQLNSWAAWILFDTFVKRP